MSSLNFTVAKKQSGVERNTPKVVTGRKDDV
jgi:hypothetical protein